MQGSLKDQLYDIYGVWHIPWWQTTTFYAVLACCGACLVAAAVWLGVRRVRARKKMTTSWDRALYDLEQLHQQGMISQQSKDFYERVIGILRTYLYERFGLVTQGKTDQELMAYLATSSFPEVHLVQDQLQAIMNGSLLVRFANQHAVVAQMEQDWVTAVTIIKHTTPPSTH